MPGFLRFFGIIFSSSDILVARRSAAAVENLLRCSAAALSKNTVAGGTANSARATCLRGVVRENGVLRRVFRLSAQARVACSMTGSERN